MLRRNKTASVWSLGNTTVRNPERILSALRVFYKYYDNGKSFSGNAKLQGEFFEKLLTHTENGEPYIPGKSKEIPIYSFISENGRVQMPNEDYKQKNGRLWISPMDSFGFISAYREKSKLSNPGMLYIQFPEMEGELWLRQLLKFQYPNHKTEIGGGANIRPALVIFKLMLELDGLSAFEIGFTHLLRNEDITELIKMIKDYRIKRKEGNIGKLQEFLQKKQLAVYFSSDLKKSMNGLLNLIGRIKIGFLKSEKRILEELCVIFALGKGSETKRAEYAINQAMNLIRKKDFEKKKYENIFLDYFFLVKTGTIWKDYPDLTKRYLSMCRILQMCRIDNGETRLRIDPQYEKIIKDVIDNIGPVLKIENDTEVKKYLEYLWNVNKPELIIDDQSFLEEQINLTKSRLKKMGWDYKIDLEKLKSPLISQERLVYNILQKDLRLALESEFAKNIKLDAIIKRLEKLSKDTMLIPNELESLIWESLLAIGGFSGHPSSTRNFHVDTNFKSLFTAAGNQPDMQFSYEKFDVIVEVTKNEGKTQWRAEAEPVTRHIAIHKFRNGNNAIGIFLAPSIHEETEREFYLKSRGVPVIIDSKGTEIFINIIPLSFSKYLDLLKKVAGSNEKSEYWTSSLLRISELIKNSHNQKDWVSKINSYISN